MGPEGTTTWIDRFVVLYFRDIPPGVFAEAVAAFGAPGPPVLVAPPPLGLTIPLFVLLAAADCARAGKELLPTLLPALACTKIQIGLSTDVDHGADEPEWIGFLKHRKTS